MNDLLKALPSIISILVTSIIILYLSAVSGIFGLGPAGNDVTANRIIVFCGFIAFILWTRYVFVAKRISRVQPGHSLPRFEPYVKITSVLGSFVTLVLFIWLFKTTAIIPKLTIVLKIRDTESRNNN